MNQTKPLTHLFWLLLSAACVVLDQLTKTWALHTLIPGEILHPLPLLHFTLAYNRGVMFGWLGEQGAVTSWVLIIVALIISLYVIYLFWRKTNPWWMNTALMLILGGALGNVIDRFRFGEVTDFITLQLNSWHWPTVFNVADIVITTGCILFIIDMFIRRVDEK